MSEPSANLKSNEAILVLAPTGSDGPMTVALLLQMGLTAVACRGIFDLCHHLEHPAGAILIAEEALYSSSSNVLLEALSNQPAWSDLPVIVITSSGQLTPESLQVFKSFRRAVNVSLLERPFRKVTLASILEGALRARRRQYQVRDLLDEQRRLHAESTRQLATIKASEEKIRTALTREEERSTELQSLMAAAPVAVWVAHDPECRHVTGNEFSYQLLRAKPQSNVSVNSDPEKPGESHFRVFKNGVLVPPGEHPMQKAAATGQPVWNEEQDFVFLDGSSVSILANAVPLRDSTGRVIGAIGTGTDVTERKKMIMDLREREARLQFVLGAAQLGIWQYDLVTGHFQASPILKKLFGFGENEDVSTIDKMRSVLHPDDRARVEATVKKAVEETGEYQCDYRIIHPDRSVRFISARGQSLLDSSGKPIVMVGITADITARKEAELALATQVDRLQLLSDSIGHLLTAREPHDIVRGLFPRVANHLNLDTYFNFLVNKEGDALELHTCAGIPDDVIQNMKRLEFGQAICGTVAQTRQPIIATHIQESDYNKAALVRSFGIRSYACNPLMVGDRLIGTLSFASHTRDTFTDDELQFLRVISQYVSVALDRLRTEAELQNLNNSLEQEVANRTAKLRESIEELEGFSYSITHDLRAPLRAMQSFAAILEEEAEPRLSPTDRDYLKRIITSSHRMDKLIRDVLAYSRVLRMDLRLEPLDLAALIRSILQSYPNYAPEKADIQLDGRFCQVLGNEAALTQCISNFLTNAIKFVRPGIKPKVLIRAERKGERVRVWFEDNGIGISPEYLDRIFHLFQRLNRDYEGTGIGLSIVRKAVERMGGSVGVESEPGQGSRFWIELTCASPLHD